MQAESTQDRVVGQPPATRGSSRLPSLPRESRRGAFADLLSAMVDRISNPVMRSRFEWMDRSLAVQNPDMTPDERRALARGYALGRLSLLSDRREVARVLAAVRLGR